jgi:hypothetical protein
MLPIPGLTQVVAYGYTGGAGMQDTPHDFVVPDHAEEFGVPTGFTNPSKSTEGRTFEVGRPGAVGLCTFCHTAHKGIQTSLLWNHTLSSNSFDWTDADQTVGGTALPSNIDSWAGSSKLCLSCHDGSVAIGELAWFQGAIKTGTATPPSYPTQKVSGGVDNTAEDELSEHAKYQVTGAAGNMNGNHPVAVPYPWGGAKNTYNSIQTGAGVVLGEFVSDPTVDDIRLYTMSGGGQVVVAIDSSHAGTDVGMECGSCHDPHNGPAVDPDPITNRPRFLRGTIFGDGPGGSNNFAGVGDDDYLCVKCHKK